MALSLSVSHWFIIRLFHYYNIPYTPLPHQKKKQTNCMCTYYTGLSFLKSFEHLNEFPVTYYWPVLRSVRWMGIYITPIHDFVSNSNRTCTLKKKKNRRVHRALQHFRFFLKKWSCPRPKNQEMRAQRVVVGSLPSFLFAF